jgi:hypothetical protein
MNLRGAFKHMIGHTVKSVRYRRLLKSTLCFRLVISHSMRLSICCSCSVVTCAYIGNRKYLLLSVGLNSCCHVVWVPILFSFFVGIFFLGTFALYFTTSFVSLPFSVTTSAPCLVDLTQQILLLVFQFPFFDLTAIVDQGLLIVEALRSHSDTPHSVGLLWMSDQPEAEPLPNNTQHSQQTYILAFGRIRNRSLSKRATANPCLRRRGLWHRR